MNFRLATGLLALLLLSLLPSCQKEIGTAPIATSDSAIYWRSVTKTLPSLVTREQFSHLDLSRSYRSAIDSQGVPGWLVQIPVSGTPALLLKGDTTTYSKVTLLLRTNSQGEVKDARYLRFTHNFSRVKVEDLQGRLLLHSAIENGNVTGLDKNVDAMQQRVVPDPYIELPEVIVVGVRTNSASGITYSTWLSLLPYLDNAGGNAQGWGYSDGGSSYGSSGGGGGSSAYYNSDPWSDGAATGGYNTDIPLLVDFENMDWKPGIDLSTLLNCFDKIADAGAICQMTLYTDIPVDNDPAKFFDWSAGSPGHAFIGLSKRNGSQQVKQSFGFYPKSGLKSVFMGRDVPSKIVDNAEHEFNGSFELSLTPAQLRDVIMRAKELAKKSYSIEAYNCTDYAIDLFNWPQLFRDHLTIPLSQVPGSSQNPAPTTRTPQGLYMKLQEMRNSGHARASQIQIPVDHKAPASTGTCP